VRRIQTHAGLSWFSIFQKVPAPCQILLLAGILTFEMRGWLSLDTTLQEEKKTDAALTQLAVTVINYKA